MFDYNLFTIFESVSNETLYNARTLFSDDGKPLVDNFSLTEDERIFFDMKLKDIANDILQIANRLFINYEIERGKITFQEKGDAADSEYLILLSKHIESYINDAMLYHWYLSVKADIAEIYSKKLEVLIHSINSLITKCSYYNSPNTISLCKE